MNALSRKPCLNSQATVWFSKCHPLLRNISCLAICYLATNRSLLFVVTGTWFPIRCSAIDICSGSIIPAFSRHVTNMLEIYNYNPNKLKWFEKQIFIHPVQPTVGPSNNIPCLSCFSMQRTYISLRFIQFGEEFGCKPLNRWSFLRCLTKRDEVHPLSDGARVHVVQSRAAEMRSSAWRSTYTVFQWFPTHSCWPDILISCADIMIDCSRG
jgi:hypothetical protein